jgi:hypothetical protein
MRSLAWRSLAAAGGQGGFAGGGRNCGDAAALAAIGARRRHSRRQEHLKSLAENAGIEIKGLCPVIASEAKQSNASSTGLWIASSRRFSQ